jgi:hypothetical protein
LADGEVVEKEEGSRSLNGNVIDAVVDQIGAHRVVHPHREGYFELGADAIRTRNQNRVRIFADVQAEETAEAANIPKHLLVEGFLGEILDALFGAVSLGNIHASGSVGDSGLI